MAMGTYLIDSVNFTWQIKCERQAKINVTCLRSLVAWFENVVFVHAFCRAAFLKERQWPFSNSSVLIQHNLQSQIVKPWRWWYSRKWLRVTLFNDYPNFLLQQSSIRPSKFVGSLLLPCLLVMFAGANSKSLVTICWKQTWMCKHKNSGNQGNEVGKYLILLHNRPNLTPNHLGLLYWLHLNYNSR